MAAAAAESEPPAATRAEHEEEDHQQPVVPEVKWGSRGRNRREIEEVYILAAVQESPSSWE